MSGRLIRPRIFTCRSRKKLDSVPTPCGGGGGGTAVLPTNRLMGMCSWMGLHIFTTGACFLKDPFDLISQFLAHKPVNFALLVDSFIVSFSKFLKL